MTDITWTNATRRLADLIPRQNNPRQIRKPQAERLVKSRHKFGQFENITTQPDGKINNGHQRYYVWLAAFGDDFEVDVKVASRNLTEREWQEMTVLAHEGTNAEWDWDCLAGWDGVDVGDLVEWGFDEKALLGNWSAADFLGVAKDAQPNPRDLPLDVIYTLQGADATCCLAIRAGLKYGIQSSSYTLCPYCLRGDENHKVVFIDNDYFNYDHTKHLQTVKELRPKYATVMDVMTKEQCMKDKITWHSLERILDWAAELEQYAENIIVIPKYNCLDKIPERYVLGYSVPTSHGGTPLPVSLFVERRVHLLGGSWKAQLAHLSELGGSVISLDNNYIQNIARQWAQFVMPSGETKNLTDQGYHWATNPRYLALAFSFGAIGAKVNEICNHAKEKISNSLAVAETRLIKTRRKKENDTNNFSCSCIHRSANAIRHHEPENHSIRWLFDGCGDFDISNHLYPARYGTQGGGKEGCKNHHCDCGSYQFSNGGAFLDRSSLAV